MKHLLYILSLALLCALSSCGGPANEGKPVNTKAALPASFNFKQLCPFVISSSINKNQGTMATLYGNAQARTFFIENSLHTNNGETLALVTWKQQEDPHWFGGLIPGQLLSVEVIKTPASGNPVFSYQLFEGSDLHLNGDTSNRSLRIQQLIAIQPSVMP